MTNQPGARGFTVVELITTISLLGILAVVAISRLTSANAYQPSIISNAVIAELRLTQQFAFSRHHDIIEFSIVHSADEWQLATSSSGQTLSTRALEIDNTTIDLDLVGSMTPLTSPLNITFGAKGSLATLSSGALVEDPELGLEIQVGGDSEHYICLYNTGYAQGAPCV